MTQIRRPKKFAVVFATGNPHKLHEVKLILKDYPITIEQRDMKGPEIQSEDLEEIAKTSVVWTAKKSGSPTFVEDAGLFIEALRGFPGAFTSHTYKTIGIEGILKLLEGKENRRAVFKSAIAYHTAHGNPVCFLGEVHGKISLEERGVEGFGFDPIFEPACGGGKTFGEMDVNEKSACSHRAFAARRFAEWLLKNGGN